MIKRYQPGNINLLSSFIFCPPIDLLRELLGKAMENCETSLLTTGFLLARQACLEGPHTFPSYRDWFSVGHVVLNSQVGSC